MQNKQNNFAFIDGQNLNLGIQSLGWKLSFKRLRKYLYEKHQVSTAYYFIGFVPTNQALYSFLQKTGYTLVFKPTIPDENGRLKGNIDANLVLQAMIDYERYNKAVLVSSDGDFYCLIDYLNKNGKLKIVLSPYKKTCSSLLKKSAKGKITYLDSLKGKLEYVRY